MMHKNALTKYKFLSHKQPKNYYCLVSGTFDITESSHLHILPDIKVIQAISYWSSISQ